MMKLGILVLMLALLAGAAFSVNSAALQVSGYKTVPDTVYPGTASQLQVTLQNSGSDPASQVVINYDTPAQLVTSQVNMGDIGPSSSAVASIPFTVPLNTSSGYFVINLNIVYFSDSSHTSVKNTPVTIPVVVAQHQILGIRTISVSPNVIQAGSAVTAQLEISNTGGVMNNVVVSTPENSTFSIEGQNQKTVGTIPFNSSASVSVDLRSSSSTPAGKYTIPLIVSYQDSLQNVINQTVSIGPVAVSDSSSAFRTYFTPLNDTKAGAEARFALTLENVGDSATSAIVDLNQTSEFTPIGPTRIYFDDIEPGANQTRVVTIGVGVSTSAGYYNLPMSITTNGQTLVQNVGIAVDAPPEVTISTDTQPSFVSAGSREVKVLAEIANVGNGQIRSVYVSAGRSKDLEVVGATDKFMGTLNVDDFATFQLTVNVPPGLSAGTYSIPITIDFKDSKNQEHVIQKDVEITIYSASDASRLNAVSGGTAATGTAGNFRGSGGGLIGFNLPTAIGAVIVIGIGFFAYKRFKGSRK
jgi:hypothetical protein